MFTGSGSITSGWSSSDIVRSAVPSSLKADLRLVASLRLWSDAPLAPFTTVGTGGKAGLLVTVSDQAALSKTLELVERAGVDWMCLGAGSNLLVADEGYPGVIIKLDESYHYVEGLEALSSSEADASTEESSSAGSVVLKVGGGAYLARLAAVVAEHGISGLEFACGIPGSVGGGVLMNAGAHERSMADVVEEIEVASSAGCGRLTSAQVQWAYRSCRIPQHAVVTEVRLALRKDDATAVLERHRALLRSRRVSQPRGVRTFGSVFKNPTGDAAGRLLEAAGLKGLRRGGAEVSTVHANFLVNLGDATTADMLTLMGQMREAVERSAGIILEPEVKLLGTRFPWVPGPRGS